MRSARDVIAFYTMLGLAITPGLLQRADDEDHRHRHGIPRATHKHHDHEAAARLREERKARKVANHLKRYPKGRQP